MKKLSLFFVFLYLLIFFQSCGNTLFQSSPIVFDPFEVMFNSKVAKADFSWLIEANRNNLALNSNNHLEKWIDQSENRVSLFPPFFNESQLPDISNSGLLADSSLGAVIHMTEGSSMSSSSYDSYNLGANEYSFLFEIQNIQFPLEGTPEVRLLSLIPDNITIDGSLILELKNSETGLQFIVRHFFTEQKFRTISFPINTIKNPGPLAIGLRVSRDFEAMSISINGELITSTPSSTGEIGLLPYAPRILTLHTSDLDTGGSFEFFDIGIFKRLLSDQELHEYSLSLQRTYEKRIPTPLVELEQLLPNANNSNGYNQIKSIFEKSTGVDSCMNCHTEFNSKSNLLSAQSNGVPWVTPKNSSSSNQSSGTESLVSA